MCYFNNQLKFTCTAFADVFDWENGPDDISQISNICVFGLNFTVFRLPKQVFHDFGLKLCLKMKINMLSVFPDLKYIGVGKKSITIT